MFIVSLNFFNGFLLSSYDSNFFLSNISFHDGKRFFWKVLFVPFQMRYGKLRRSKYLARNYKYKIYCFVREENENLGIQSESNKQD